MNVGEFKKQTGKLHLYDCFWHPQTLDSKVGPFVMELTVAMNAEPAQELADAMQELARRFESDKDTVLQMMFQEYTDFSESEPEVMVEYFQTPINLTIDELTPYIRSRLLTVSSALDDLSDPYYPRVLIRPFWDLEGFCVRFNGDQIKRLRPRRGKDY